MCQSLFDLGANDCKKLSADSSDIPRIGDQLRWGDNDPATGKLPSYTFPYPLKKTENFKNLDTAEAILKKIWKEWKKFF